MTGGALFWLIVYGVSALLFFGIALVVGVRGFVDLRDLVRRSERAPSHGSGVREGRE